MNNMFQSLIGILQTHQNLLYGFLMLWFQSLIGILQTGEEFKVYAYHTWFQSLIGILQTCPYHHHYYRYYCVSIPHRYSTNQNG